MRVKRLESGGQVSRATHLRLTYTRGGRMTLGREGNRNVQNFPSFGRAFDPIARSITSDDSFDLTRLKRSKTLCQCGKPIELVGSFPTPERSTPASRQTGTCSGVNNTIKCCARCTRRAAYVLSIPAIRNLAEPLQLRCATREIPIRIRDEMVPSPTR